MVPPKDEFSHCHIIFIWCNYTHIDDHWAYFLKIKFVEIHRPWQANGRISDSLWCHNVNFYRVAFPWTPITNKIVNLLIYLNQKLDCENT
jgi:hypothetical protein